MLPMASCFNGIVLVSIRSIRVALFAWLQLQQLLTGECRWMWCSTKADGLVGKSLTSSTTELVSEWQCRKLQASSQDDFTASDLKWLQCCGCLNHYKSAQEQGLYLRHRYLRARAISAIPGAEGDLGSPPRGSPAIPTEF